MKKIILMICLLFLVTGCVGKKMSKATITNNDGDTETLSGKELCNIYNENEAKFKKNYVGSKIIFDGTVKKVNSYFYSAPDKKTIFDSIEFNEGFIVYIQHNQYELISDLSKGDKLHIESNIYSGFGCSSGIDIRGTDKVGGYDYSTLNKTIIEKID